MVELGQKLYRIFRNGRLYDVGQGSSLVIDTERDTAKASAGFLTLQEAITHSQGYSAEREGDTFTVRDTAGEVWYEITTRIKAK